jgi:hypothetical protein
MKVGNYYLIRVGTKYNENIIENLLITYLLHRSTHCGWINSVSFNFLPSRSTNLKGKKRLFKKFVSLNVPADTIF